MKGKDAERVSVLQLFPWAYSKELYDCHQFMMLRYPGLVRMNG